MFSVLIVCGLKFALEDRLRLSVKFSPFRIDPKEHEVHELLLDLRIFTQVFEVGYKP